MQTTIPNTISIIYKGNTYEVDQNLLCQSSIAFSELLKNFLSKGESGKPQLEILNENFSERNVFNFLKICQNLPTDVQNSEIPEICEIALMFHAKEIYLKAFNFVRSNIDSNFSIQEEKYNQNSSQFFNFSFKEKFISHHISNFSDLEFESDESEDERNSIKNNNGFQNMKIESCNEQSIIYSIKSEILSRGQRFVFMKNNKPLLSAKVKGNKIFLFSKYDSNVDINSPNFIPRIERESNLNNQVILANQKFGITHILGDKEIDHFSMETSFQLDDKMINLFSKDRSMKTNSIEYKRLISGIYNRSFRKSDKNMALQDKNGNVKLILRKVGHNSFEVECDPDIPELIIFSIAVTQIVGPFFDSVDAFSHGKESVIPTIPFSIA